MGNGNGTSTVDPAHVAQAMELGEHSKLLRALLAEARTNPIDIAVADSQHREMVLDQFPVTGSKRALVYRTGSGFDGLAVPTTGVLVLGSNVARLGGTIVNLGANAVILYLTSTGVQTAGAPAIWLAATGGSWDFRLGNVLWCGSVSAVAQTAGTTVTVAEV